MSRIVIALGGNALGNTPYEQLELVTETAKPIVDLIEAATRSSLPTAMVRRSACQPCD